MPTAVAAVRLLELAVFAALAALSLRRARAHGDGDPAARWLAATFAVLAVVVLAGYVFPPESSSELASWLRKALLVDVALFPYCLFRFMATFDDPGRGRRRVAEVLTLALVVWAPFLPKLLPSDMPRATVTDVYLAGIFVQWTVLSAMVTVRLWQVGGAQARVARNRMRVVAAGCASLNLALGLALAAQPDSTSVVQLVGGCITLASAVLFFTGFAPPRVLRLVWRGRDAQILRDAEAALMAVLTPSEVGAALLPHVTRLFGEQGSVLLDRDGRVVAASGVEPGDASVTALALLGARQPVVVQPGLLAVAIRSGWLAVRSGRLSPFFGREEADLLTGLGVLADLALERAELFELERAARQAAERANNELETFVYSVSHDLKSPLVSLLGFLDYLEADLAEHLTDDTRFYLSRITASGMYMQALIHDLLELSRIGRVQTESTEVDLGVLVGDIVAERRLSHPAATFEVGPLPAVEMNPVRARQLFTNLVDNALDHAGRSDVTVAVTADATGARVTVADNGKGIPDQYREKVFGVFERLEQPAVSGAASAGTGTTGTSGTGIGLAVCRKIAEQYGATVHEHDAHPGACFVVHFPDALVRRAPTALEAV